MGATLRHLRSDEAALTHDPGVGSGRGQFSALMQPTQPHLNRETGTMGARSSLKLRGET